MERSLENENTLQAAQSTSDIKVTGNPDAWQLLCKASSKSQGWMKSTKLMHFDGYVVVQVTTEHRCPNSGKVLACAEALTTVPTS